MEGVASVSTGRIRQDLAYFLHTKNFLYFRFRLGWSRPSYYFYTPENSNKLSLPGAPSTSKAWATCSAATGPTVVSYGVSARAAIPSPRANWRVSLHGESPVGVRAASAPAA